MTGREAAWARWKSQESSQEVACIYWDSKPSPSVPSPGYMMLYGYPVACGLVKVENKQVFWASLWGSRDVESDLSKVLLQEHMRTPKMFSYHAKPCDLSKAVCACFRSRFRQAWANCRCGVVRRWFLCVKSCSLGQQRTQPNHDASGSDNGPVRNGFLNTYSGQLINQDESFSFACDTYLFFLASIPGVLTNQNSN